MYRRRAPEMLIRRIHLNLLRYLHRAMIGGIRLGLQTCSLYLLIRRWNDSAALALPISF
jgi:hypothetical protein